MPALLTPVPSALVLRRARPWSWSFRAEMCRAPAYFSALWVTPSATGRDPAPTVTSGPLLGTRRCPHNKWGVNSCPPSVVGPTEAQGRMGHQGAGVRGKVSVLLELLPPGQRGEQTGQVWGHAGCLRVTQQDPEPGLLGSSALMASSVGGTLPGRVCTSVSCALAGGAKARAGAPVVTALASGGCPGKGSDPGPVPTSRAMGLAGGGAQ